MSASPDTLEPERSPDARPAPWKRALRFLKPLFAIAVLAFVVTNDKYVPWRDKLLWTLGESEVEIAGDIQGDWKAESIRYRLAEDFTPPADWNDEARRVLAPGREVALSRGAEDPLARELGGRFAWRPGMPRVFGEMDPRGLLLAFGSMLVALCCVITRWWRLLRVARCPTTWFSAVRLTFLGLFFNLVMPGLTGGDLIKAVLVVRENPARRADALVSVFVDRLIGLLVLAALAAVVIAFLGDEFSEIRLWVILFLAAGLLGALLYSSRKLRRLVRFDGLLERLPMSDRIKKIDRALLVYSNHPVEMLWATGLSLANHLIVVWAVFQLGRAFGDTMGLMQYMAVVPVANIVSSLPVAPGGWGVGEAAYAFLFAMVGASATIGVAVSITFRLCLMAMGLLGGIFLLLPGGKVNLKQIEGLEAST